MVSDWRRGDAWARRLLADGTHLMVTRDRRGYWHWHRWTTRDRSLVACYPYQRWQAGYCSAAEAMAAADLAVEQRAA